MTARGTRLAAWGMACALACTLSLPAALQAAPTAGVSGVGDGSQTAQASQVSQQALLAQVRERVQSAPVVRGQFTQLKTVQGFRQPLKSSGDFVVARGKGIAWQVRQPFASTLIVRPDSLLSRGADGSTAVQMRAQDEPVLRTINAMLFSVVSADLAQLTHYFEVSGQVQGAGWRLHLVPRDPVLAQWLQAVDLSGQQFVQSVQLQEARGDRSQIQMANPVAEQALRAQDAALFD
ncbi:outer membrane lipoprotein carrier protein LolA [Delftia acidovorans]|uniref:outer membrane lipoprotein carrier protein LolA n=1 Tax=Delftia acidovorans TaxID=80866 RepID=UPI001ED9055E|nr:outer membrane lipoprotein carrier protein LolA [Delftia acidovorans]